MSRSWAGGSTTAWRKVRAAVLARDAWRCQLQLVGCTEQAVQVHHLLGKVHGDNPAHLVAACAHCNQQAGDPLAADPAPMPWRW